MFLKCRAIYINKNLINRLTQIGKMQGYINLNEFIFLYVTSHIYVAFLLHYTITDYFSFTFIINVLYFASIIVYHIYKICCNCCHNLKRVKKY